MVVFGDLTVQLPAVGTINIGEDGDRVFRIPRTEHQHLGFRNGVNQLRAHLAAMRLRQIVIVGDVEQVATESKLPIPRDIRNVSAMGQLVDPRNRRRPDVFHARTGKLPGYDRARIRGRLSRTQYAGEQQKSEAEDELPGWH